ncbi:MAG: GyrI-like domain-containing protein [Chloroflexota bacterium]
MLKIGDFAKLWNRFLLRAAEIEGCSIVAYGVCGNVDENGRFSYMAGYETTNLAHVPDGMDSWELAEQTYAVFPCTMDTISETYQHIFEKWLPQADYKLAGAPDFEFYPATFDPVNDKQMAIHMPVVD